MKSRFSFGTIVLFLGMGAAFGAAAVSASGCFGGEPDILPRRGAAEVPRNAQVRIARRDAASVRWIGPDGARLAADERRVGRGRSVARVLTATSTLAPGLHRLETRDPDLVHEFTVGSFSDQSAPRLVGELTLAAHLAPEPDSSCPENTWIRASLTLPRDDVTTPDGFSYLIFLGEPEETSWDGAELLVHAESVTGETVHFRIGEAGCGCIPRISLSPGALYRVTVRAVDAAGHLSADSLSAEIRMPH